MAFIWQANDGQTSLKAGFVDSDFPEIPTSISKKPCSFVIFDGLGIPCPHSGSVHAMDKCYLLLTVHLSKFKTLFRGF